jgi:hypothetical protein
MGALKTEELQRLWALIQTAPIPVISLLLAVVGVSATAAWFGRGQFADSKISGLEQQLAVRDDRLKLAEEKVQAQIQARQEVERQFNELKIHPQSEAIMAARLDALEKAFTQWQGTSKALETAVVHAEMHVHERSDGFDAVSATAGPH